MIQKVAFPQKKPFLLKRTAAYARVSSGKDAMLHSLSAQVSYYNQLIQSNPEWLFCGVYADEALTGTKENRAEFHFPFCTKHGYLAGNGTGTENTGC